MKSKLFRRNGELLLLGILTLLALALRLWRLDSVPPGWRDDELINVLVISQKVLAGDWAIYFADASGHEGLYHTLVAGMLRVFGFTAVGIRGLSVLFGTLTIPLTYLVGRRLFGRIVGLTAALGLAFSFWSLMYSRFGMRHISVVFFTLLAFHFLWRGFTILTDLQESEKSNGWLVNFGLVGLFLGLNFYTYFASRGVPLTLLAFFVYLALFQQPLLKRSWRGFLVMGGITAVLALPLIITLNQQPEAEARVAELAAPLIEAREGNFTLLGEHVVRTLSMFHSDGDDEWLYNIPFRPIFGPIGAIFFWLGVAIAVWRTVQIIRRGNKMPSYLTGDAAYPFLLIWWLVGIAPGFVSVPAASLGHTIVAQSAVFLLAALPIGTAFQAYRRQRENAQGNSSWYQQALGSRWVFVALALLLVGMIGWRDTADYFNEWPNRGLTRFLYLADVKELAHYLADYPELTDFGITSLLAGPWDKEAFKIDLAETTIVNPRWYNPQRAILLAIAGERPLVFSGYPNVPTLYEDWYENRSSQKAGGYQLSEINPGLVWDNAQKVCFQNGLCWLTANYDQVDQTLMMIWSVERPLDLPEATLISNPPPPGVYAGPRLLAFGQLLDAAGDFLAGDDGLWVDPYSLQIGDVFLQQHKPLISDGQQPAAIVLGLYDPMTGERILTEDGRDHIRMEIK